MSSLVRRIHAVPAPRLHLWLMLVLTFTTGINDAVGYLALDKVFTGNMTGNVVILGMALVGAEGLPVVGPALALVGFLVGAAIGGRVLRSATCAWSSGTTWLFGSVALMMIVLAVVLIAGGDNRSSWVTVATTTLAAAAMGVQAAAARVIAVKDVTTVVVTSTITGLAADFRWGSAMPAATWRRVAAVAFLILGAAVGAALLRVDDGAGLLLAGIVIAFVTLVGGLHAAHDRKAGGGAFADAQEVSAR